MKNFVIEVTPLRGSHTGEFIANFLNTTMSTYLLTYKKLSLVIRDNASNGVSACDKLKVRHFGCIGHSLHLVIGPFLIENKKKNTEEVVIEDDDSGDDDDDDVAEFELTEEETSEEIVNRVRKLTSKFRSIAKYVKNSSKAKEKIENFDAMSKSNNRDTIHVSLDVRTRWNSALEMLASLLKLKSGLQSFAHYLKTSDGKKEFSYKKLPDVTQQDWVLIEGLCVVLQPFKNVTAKLSGSNYPTFAQALPYLRRLKFFLQKAEDRLFTMDTDVQPIKKFIENYCEEEFFHLVLIDLKACCRVLLNKFILRFTGLNTNILWVTFLDPRSRKMKHLSENEYERAKNLFVKEVTNLALDDAACSESNNNMSSNTDDDYEEDPFLVGADFDSPNNEDPAPMENNSRGVEECVSAVKREIENYLDPLISVPPKTDPIHWWEENRHRFPKVAVAARKWLSVPGTSTPSERVFSDCGIALSAKRSTMRGDALMNQILLKNNLRHVLCTVSDVKKALSKFN